MKLKIERFKDMASLVAEKDEQHRIHDEWTDRQKELRSFYNGKPIMTEDEADEENLEEITNHLIGYSNMQVMENRMYSIWSTSNKFIDVDVIDEELDVIEREEQSAHINKFLNRAIYKTGRFGAFCRSVAGEISLAGRAACLNSEDGDWCPSVASKLYVPDTMGTDISELTYAFVPIEMTYNQLEALLDDEDSDDDEGEGVGNEVTVNNEVVRQLMATVDQQVQMNSQQLTSNSENQNHEATNTDESSVHSGNKTTVNLWKYFEVRYDEDSKSKVVDVLIFTDELRMDDQGEKGGDAKGHTQAPVVHYPAYFERPSQFGHLMVIDASIGGDKRYATAKGIAEITYNSDMDSEELLNRIFAGEKMRAMPRFQEGDNTDEDKLLGWNPEESTLVPRGLTEFRFGGGTGGLNNPLSLLRQNSSAQSGSSHSNTGRDGELRQQAVERQSNNQATLLSRTSDLFKSMEIIAQEMVRRFFTGEVEGDCPGYEEIMWFRSQCKKNGINLERLAEQEFGFYENIEVKVVRSSASGEIDHDMAVAERLMQNLQHFPDAVRPIIVRKFVTLVSGDPDFSDDLLELLPKIVSAQRVTAESEFEQIRRDSLLGRDTPLGQDDVHSEHAEAHNRHLQVLINEGQISSWTRAQAVHFAGIQEHQSNHIREMILNDASRGLGEQFLRQFQTLVAEADKLFQDVQRTEMESQGMSEKEIDLQIKIAEQRRKDREIAIKEADTMSNIENRERRREDVRRKGDQQFLVQKAQIDKPSR